MGMITEARKTSEKFPHIFESARNLDLFIGLSIIISNIFFIAMDYNLQKPWFGKID